MRVGLGGPSSPLIIFFIVVVEIRYKKMVKSLSKKGKRALRKLKKPLVSKSLQYKKRKKK